MMPKSTAAMRPAHRRRDFPDACRHERSHRGGRGAGTSGSARAQARRGSKPSSSRRSGSASGTPSIHSMVITSRVVRSQSIAGARMSGSSWRILGKFRRRSRFETKIHLHPNGPRQRLHHLNGLAAGAFPGAIRSAKRAAKNISARSRPKRRSTPARKTLTATDARPVSVLTAARCTCAIEAAATGSPKVSYTVSILAPNAASMMPTAACRDIGVTRSCRLSSSRATFGADDIRPRGEKLAELDVGRTQTVHRAG